MAGDRETIDEDTDQRAIPAMLTHSQSAVFAIIEANAPITVDQIKEKTPYAYRTIRYAINELEEMGLIVRRYNLLDMRRFLFLSASIKKGA